VHDHGAVLPHLFLHPDHGAGRSSADPVLQDTGLGESGLDLGTAGEDTGRRLVIGGRILTVDRSAAQDDGVAPRPAQLMIAEAGPASESEVSRRRSTTPPASRSRRRR
jgi:hypothetical protein